MIPICCVTMTAAAAMETCFTLSTIATSSIEEIATACPTSLCFFQLYIYRDRDVTRQLISRAEQAGFASLVVTVDAPFFGKRRADNRNKFKLPPHLKSAYVLCIIYRFYRLSACLCMQSTILLWKICPSVHHTLLLYQNECTFRQDFFHHLVVA